MKLVKQLTCDLHIKIALKPLQLLAFKNEVGKIVDTVQIQYRYYKVVQKELLIKERERITIIPKWELARRIDTKE